MKDKSYQEVGSNYRFFLAWRHAAFAGGLVVLGGTCSLLATAYEKALPIAWLIPLLAALASVCLWLADLRTRQIYRALVEAGKKLEGDEEGPYHALNNVVIPKGAPWLPGKEKKTCKIFSQSFALDCFFLGSASVLFVVAIYVFVRPPAPSGPPAPLPGQAIYATR